MKTYTIKALLVGAMKYIDELRYPKKYRYTMDTLDAYKELLKETYDDLDCLDGCDSYSHEPDCPIVNGMAAFRMIRERKEQCRRALEQIKLYHENMHGAKAKDFIAYDIACRALES